MIVLGRLLLALVLAGASVGRADDPPIRLSADKSVATVGDNVMIQIELPGSGDKVVSIAGFPQITLQSAGTQSSVSIVNGKMTSKNIMQYRFTPDRPGDYTIGPAKVQSGQTQLSSNAIKLVVQAGGNERMLDFQAAVRPRRVYVGQPFAAAVTAIFGSAMRPVGWNPANASGVVDMLGQEQAQQLQSTVQRGGAVFTSLTLSRWLYASTPGTKTLSGGQLEFETAAPQRRRSAFPGFPFDPFGSRTVRSAATLPEQTVSVRELPPLPAGHNFLGAVGALSAGWAQVEKHNNQLRAVLVVQGAGAAPAPHVESWVESGWRFYADQPEFSYGLRGDSGIWLTLKVPVTVVPVNDPDTAVPSWFDPNQGEYVAVPLPLQPRAVQAPAHPAELLAKAGAVASGVAAGPDQRQLAAAPDAAWALAMSDTLGLQACGVAATFWLAGVLLPHWRNRRRPVAAVARQALQRALARDDKATWEEAYAALGQVSQPEARLQQARDLIGAALYAPTFASPAAAVRQAMKEAGFA